MGEPVDKTKKGLITPIGTAILQSSTRFSLAKSVIAGGIIGALLWLQYPPSAATQPAPVYPRAGDDLRAVYANAADVAEGKRLADASCAGCHGANGISTTAAVPNLAGQRPAYLYRELRVYQVGGLGESAMNNAVKFLGDDALVKVAAYYASLDPAPAGPGNDAQAVPTDPDPVQTGKAAAAGCAGCHGETGVSKTPSMPSLAGLDPKYLVAAMTSYKNGQRNHEMMKSMLAPIRDADLNDVALYYALQSPARAQTPASGNQAAGRAAAAACAGCPRRSGCQHKSRDPKPRRSGCPIPCGSDSRLQGRIARRCNDERPGCLAR